ncbi:hypothetical protein [Shimazuella alba]|uniref:Uncharacterized protein n=1 Tax=Shimazuella alba TaxID=2690964 RepID=A0A6I4VXY3_9BACL|nr:hypothetical protein [Shimazuella alba]MXQ55723.1 hypothetical protein [Shimazuella alba]
MFNDSTILHTKSSFKRKLGYGILIFFVICVFFFTLFAAIPLDEEADPNVLSFDPEAAGLIYLSACISIFLSLIGLFIMYVGKLSSKVILIMIVICLFVNGYRILSLHQYNDRCEHVQSSVCVIGKPSFLPLW